MKSEPIVVPTQESMEGVREMAMTIANVDELETENSTREGRYSRRGIESLNRECLPCICSVSSAHYDFC